MKILSLSLSLLYIYVLSIRLFNKYIQFARCRQGAKKKKKKFPSPQWHKQKIQEKAKQTINQKHLNEEKNPLNDKAISGRKPFTKVPTWARTSSEQKEAYHRGNSS